MILGIAVVLVVGGFFVAALFWGTDSRTGFTNPRQRDAWVTNRRNEYR